ncbi:MAG: hypothetical protein JWQ19_421 [Subtercola sp.]|nr:hypothetical protein [Subtercola sp.]
MSTRSPYEIALGDLLLELHPRLRPYFAAIPAGSVGRGRGVFDVVGTPRRRIRPLLRILQSEGIAFAVWQTAVPFSVENRPTVDAHGNVAVAARRTFEFRSRLPAGLPAGVPAPRVMTDAITATEHGLVDYLGWHHRLEARLAATVVDGALHLRSTGLHVHFGYVTIAVPRVVAPHVELVERFDDTDERQHVSVRIVAPLLGTVYEYSGTFVYSVEPDETVEPKEPIDTGACLT